MALRRHSSGAAIALLAATVLSVALGAPALAQPGSTTTTTAAGRGPTTSAVTATSTTTQPPAATTTTLPVGPPTTTPGPTTTVPAPTTTTTKAVATTTTAPPGPPTTLVDPQKLAGLLRSLTTDLARMSAIQSFTQAKAAAAIASTTGAIAPSAGKPAHSKDAAADAGLVAAASAQLAAVDAKNAAQAALVSARHRLNQLAVAYYVHAGIGVAPTASISNASTGTDAAVMLALLLPEERGELDHANRALTQATKDEIAAKATADRLVASRVAALEAAARVALTTTTTTTTVAPPASATAPGDQSTGPGTGQGTAAVARPASHYTGTGLSILGPPVLTAVELAGWYAGTGRQPALTVPLATLTDAYQADGVTYGVRDDIAFTQSIIETGYFGFPSGGQVASADNNFAGIGACDSCHGGSGFADAKSGVAAQLQLLHNYASSQALPGPLDLTSGPTGCCPTWMSLTGVWATNPSYGFTILTLYKQILEWVLPRRAAKAGL